MYNKCTVYHQQIAIEALDEVYRYFLKLKGCSYCYNMLCLRQSFFYILRQNGCLDPWVIFGKGQALRKAVNK